MHVKGSRQATEAGGPQTHSVGKQVSEEEHPGKAAIAVAEVVAGVEVCHFHCPVWCVNLAAAFNCSDWPHDWWRLFDQSNGTTPVDESKTSKLPVTLEVDSSLSLT